MASDTVSLNSGFSNMSIDFPVVPETDASRPLTKTETMDAQWLATVRERARELYLQAKHKRIPRAKQQPERTPLDGSGEAVDVGECEYEPPVLSEDEARASINNVASLLDKLSLNISVASSSRANAKEDEEDLVYEVPSPILQNEEESLDWRQPGQLEIFLGRCAQGWEMQNELLTQLAQTHRVMKRMKNRIQALQDGQALLAWYATQKKGGSTDNLPSSEPLVESVLKEAETAIFEAAAATMTGAANILEKTA